VSSPRFFDFRFGGRVDELRAGLDAFAPDVVFVWRPEIVPQGPSRTSTR
jgi:hypothetical protein